MQPGRGTRARARSAQGTGPAAGRPPRRRRAPCPLADFIRYGSAVSGPLLPQLILVALAFLARRESRLGLVGTGALGVMGLLIGFNGCASAFSNSESAPQAVATVAGLVLAALGILISVLAARRLLGR